jgi:protease IV
MEAHKTIQSIFHILGILVILGFLSLQAGGCLILVSAMSSAGEGGDALGGSEAHDEFAFGDEEAAASFLRIPIFGVISAEAEENLLGVRKRSLPETVEMLLAHAREDASIDGLLLDIDSPGGAVDPSDVIFHELRRFREETGKPVVARMNGMAASGGYYIAMGADKILAHPSCLTGSIGVIIQAWNGAGMLEKVGLELVTLTSGPNKDLLNPGKPMSEEHRVIIQGIVDDAYDSFVGAVSAGREMDAERVRKLADGRIYTARQALELDLVDAVGYEEELLAMLREAAGVEAVEVVDHVLPSPFWEMLEMGMEGFAERLRPGAELESRVNDHLLAPGLYYLWRPSF